MANVTVETVEKEVVKIERVKEYTLRLTEKEFADIVEWQFWATCPDRVDGFEDAPRSRALYTWAYELGKELRKLHE